MEIFTAEKLSQSTTRISILNNVYCYLVEGRNQAVLLDTGFGYGNIREFVESLTQKPIIVILTHGHVDHIGGAAAFETVYLNEKDWDITLLHDGIGRKSLYASMVLKDGFNETVKSNLCPARQGEYLPLEDGQLFDLGDITLEMITVPGHTYGTVCVLNRQERWILFGDACSHSVFLWSKEATDVATYLENLKKLKKHEHRYDTIYFSHRSLPADSTIIDGVMDVCQEILEGKDDAIPYIFRDFKGLKKAKATDQHWIREDGGIGNIVYGSDKV